MRRLDPFGGTGDLQLARSDSGKRLITIGRRQRARAEGAGTLIDDTDHEAVAVRVGSAVEELGEREPLTDEISRLGGLIEGHRQRLIGHFGDELGFEDNAQGRHLSLRNCGCQQTQKSTQGCQQRNSLRVKGAAHPRP